MCEILETLKRALKYMYPKKAGSIALGAITPNSLVSKVLAFKI